MLPGVYMALKATEQTAWPSWQAILDHTTDPKERAEIEIAIAAKTRLANAPAQ